MAFDFHVVVGFVDFERQRDQAGAADDHIVKYHVAAVAAGVVEQANAVDRAAVGAGPRTEAVGGGVVAVLLTLNSNEAGER